MWHAIITFGIAIVVSWATAETWLFLFLGKKLGIGWTMAWVFGTLLLGLALIFIQGTRVLFRIHKLLQAEILPIRELIDLALIIFAGGMLALPGFLSDALGTLLFIPMLRHRLGKIIYGFIKPHLEENRLRGAYPPPRPDGSRPRKRSLHVALEQDEAQDRQMGAPPIQMAQPVGTPLTVGALGGGDNPPTPILAPEPQPKEK